ncbi:DUF4469 domain-containing protein [Treponema socranskii]|uniref:DUF4469 domain-containing protein n=1 Tax=Treponema socranskii TaxID=53419 RepID=UPI003D8D7DCB
MKTFERPEHRVSMMLYKNRFDKTGESFFGRIHRSNKTINLENLIGLIDERDTGISAHLVQHSARLLYEEIMRQLKLGKAVNVLGIGTLYLGADGIVKGKNPSPTDAPPLCLRFTPSPEVSKELKRLSVSLVVQSKYDPQIDMITDLFTQKENEIVTCGKSLRISGNRIRILGTLEDCGIYFVPKDGSDLIKVKAEHIFTNSPSLVEFFVPAELEKDKEYAIRICTQFSSGQVTVKELRTTETDFYLKAV